MEEKVSFMKELQGRKARIFIKIINQFYNLSRNGKGSWESFSEKRNDVVA